MTRAQTAHLKERFLEHFATMGNITRACTAAGISRRVVYAWQEKDEQFSLAFNEANAIATEHLEAEAWIRATEGTQKPVYQGGQLVGHIPDKSDTLLIFLLKARNPAKYRDRYDGAADGEQPLKVVDSASFEAL